MEPGGFQGGEPSMITSKEYTTTHPVFYRTFTVSFYGRPITTTVTWYCELICSWIDRVIDLQSRMGDRLVVGLGVQRPGSNSASLDSKAATVQICVDDICLIFPLRHGHAIPQSLIHFLTSPAFIFVGIQNAHHNGILMSFNPSLRVPAVDLRLAAGMPNASVEEMVRQNLDISDYVDSLDPVGRSDWSAVNLTEEQVQYACVYAYISFQIGIVLGAWKWR